MRVPGFDHIDKDRSRKLVELQQFHPERRYTIDQMLQAFPAVVSSDRPPSSGEPRQRAEKGQFATWDALRAELGRRIMSHETAHQTPAGNWACRGICPAGEGPPGFFYDPPKNQAHCNRRCEQSAILKAFGLPEAPSFQNANNIKPPNGRHEEEAP